MGDEWMIVGAVAIVGVFTGVVVCLCRLACGGLCRRRYRRVGENVDDYVDESSV
jgi:hypothetical protein